MPATRVYIHSLGCPKNDADSAALSRRLRSLGLSTMETPEEATHILLNTCGFIEDAKAESIGAILEATGNFPGKPVLVMGCLVQRYRGELEQGIPEVSGWFGLGELDRLVAELAGGATEEHGFGPGAVGGDDRGERGAVSKESRSYAYVKISDGCDHRCSFCAIPAIKGPYAALPLEAVVEQAEAALAEGARELVLVGQDTAIWRDGSSNLLDLLDRLAGYDTLERVRLLYLQPEHVSAALLEHMAGADKLCRYLDIPFQHVSRRLLRSMRRWGGGEEYLALLDRARQLMPDVSLRSTFIVGFPGESAEDFEELLDFVEEADLHHAGAFLYSPEEGTAAADLRPRVARRVARERLQRLSAILLSRAEVALGALVGSTVEVLIDLAAPGDGPEGTVAVGRTCAQAPDIDGVTYLRGGASGSLRPGQLVRAMVTDLVGVDLMARVDET